MAKKHKNFKVIETGWCKLDKLYIHDTKIDNRKKELLSNSGAKKIILYAPTFSPSLTSTLKLFDEIIKLSKKDEYLIIWTTTPWTIPYNLGVMVNPEEDYIKAKVDGEVWVVAAKLAGVFIQGVADKHYEVIETIKGENLEGVEYEHPLYDELLY